MEQALQEKGPNWIESSLEGKGSESAGGQGLMLSQQRSLAAVRGNAPRAAQHRQQWEKGLSPEKLPRSVWHLKPGFECCIEI